MTKEEQIIKEILSIPLEKWDGFFTELKGFKIQLCPVFSGSTTYIEIDGVAFHSNEFHLLQFELLSFQHDKKKNTQQHKIDLIHNKLFNVQQ